MHKVATALLSLTLLSPVCVAQNSPKQTVNEFLRAWLIRKDMSFVRKSFAAGAFTNNLMLSEQCADYLKEKEFRHPERVRRKVIRYLSYLSHQAQGQTLKEIPKFDWDDSHIETFGGERLSLIKVDGYALIKSARLEFSDSDWAYLKSKYPSRSYLFLIMFVKLKDKEGPVEFPIYFVWYKKNNSWKIIHLGTECQ